MILSYHIKISLNIIIMLAKYCCCFVKTKNQTNEPLLIEEIYREQSYDLPNDNLSILQKEQEYYQIIKEATQIKNKFNAVKS